MEQQSCAPSCSYCCSYPPAKELLATVHGSLVLQHHSPATFCRETLHVVQLHTRRSIQLSRSGRWSCRRSSTRTRLFACLSRKRCRRPTCRPSRKQWKPHRSSLLFASIPQGRQSCANSCGKASAYPHSEHELGVVNGTMHLWGTPAAPRHRLPRSLTKQCIKERTEAAVEAACQRNLTVATGQWLVRGSANSWR